MYLFTVKGMLCATLALSSMAPCICLAQVDEATEHMQEELNLKIGRARDASDNATHFAHLAAKRASDAQKEAERAQQAAKQAAQIVKKLEQQAALVKSKEIKA